MYVYDEQKIEKEKRKIRLFILMNSLMYVIIPIIIGFLKINKNIISLLFLKKYVILIIGKMYFDNKSLILNLA